MVQLLDGPCLSTLLLKRAPVYLRAVKDKVTGEIDALDQLEDTPNLVESVFVYKRVGEVGTAHLDGRDKGGKRFGGWYAMAQYRYLPDVDGETLRDNDAWRKWVMDVERREDSIPCGNCGAFRTITNNLVEKCRNCGDDEYELGGVNP